jgi:hypothetical protein
MMSTVKDYAPEVTKRWSLTAMGGESVVENISGEQSLSHRDLPRSKSLTPAIFTFQWTFLHSWSTPSSHNVEVKSQRRFAATIVVDSVDADGYGEGVVARVFIGARGSTRAHQILTTAIGFNNPPGTWRNGADLGLTMGYNFCTIRFKDRSGLGSGFNSSHFWTIIYLGPWDFMKNYLDHDPLSPLCGSVGRRQVLHLGPTWWWHARVEVMCRATDQVGPGGRCRARRRDELRRAMLGREKGRDGEFPFWRPKQNSFSFSFLFPFQIQFKFKLMFWTSNF